MCRQYFWSSKPYGNLPILCLRICLDVEVLKLHHWMERWRYFSRRFPKLMNNAFEVVDPPLMKILPTPMRFAPNQKCHWAPFHSLRFQSTSNRSAQCTGGVRYALNRRHGQCNIGLHHFCCGRFTAWRRLVVSSPMRSERTFYTAPDERAGTPHWKA